MNIINLITKKKDNQCLTYEEWEYVISKYLNKEIADYQMSALLMAVTINGMSDEETINLTKIMLHSGDIIDLSKLKGTIVDKHSTGGVGDKITLVLAPLVAACGLPVAKMSGRGLGYTGGTIDKLEAIENFKVELTNEEFIKQVSQINVAIISQTDNLVTADKKIYALRDVTGTVASIPLIAASIMSKKLASGADKILIDVKVGTGALVNDFEEAKKLAKLMVKIGKEYDRETVCVLTNMNEPLGFAIGNGIEVKESLDFLKGKAIPDLYNLTTSLATIMVSMGKGIAMKDALSLVIEKLKNGEAYQKFLEMVKYQGGNIDKLVISSKVHSLKSNQEGYLQKINTLKLGNLVKELGGGRNHKDDIIDLGVGFLLNKKVGDYVLENEELLKVYYGSKDIKIKDILSCFEISIIREDISPLIYEVIN